MNDWGNAAVQEDKVGKDSHIADDIRVDEGAVILVFELLATHTTLSSMSIALGRKRDVSVGGLQSPDGWL